MIRFSCGCESDNIDDEVDIIYKSYTRDGSKSVTFAFVCKSCANSEIYDIIENNHEAINNWMQEKND